MGTATRADAAPVWHRRRVRIYDREAPLGYLLLAPTLVVLGIFLLYPFLFGIWLSITDSELGSLGNFIGLGNYRFEFRNTDGVFYGAVVNTFLEEGVDDGSIEDAVRVAELEAVVPQADEVAQAPELGVRNRQPDPEQEGVEEKDAQDEEGGYKQQIPERRLAVVDPHTPPVPCR